MSFGYSIGDVVSLGQLAWKVYKSCKDAPESFKNVSQEALSLHALLMEVEENLSAQTLSSTRQARLKTIEDGCRNVLEELQSLVNKYESLGTQSKRTWDRMKWHHNDIAELRSRLSSNALLLTAFISAAQVVVEKKLDKLLQDFQDGKYEGSAITTQTVDSLSTDEKETWRIIRKELEGIGITVAAFDANRDFIMDWFKTAVASGAFEEQTLEDRRAPLKSPMRGGRVTRVATLIAWVLRYDKELINAASLGQKMVVQRLLEKGADVNAKRDGLTALQWAARFGYEAVVRLLLEKGADINEKGNGGTALVLAAWKGHWAVVRLLLENGADIDAKWNGGTALVLAAWKGRGVVVRLLLENGADIDAKWNGETALVFAARYGHEAVVRLLLENGADIDAKWNGETVLVLAARKGHGAVVRLLLEKGADINEKGSGGTALMLAAWKGHEAVVRLLLEKGADINEKGDGGTALMLAAENGHEAVVLLLLEKGADINEKGNGGTALVLAAWKGHWAVVRLLLENGADIDAKWNGETALVFAARSGHEAVVRLLWSSLTPT